jgi:hypothetical protein
MPEYAEIVKILANQFTKDPTGFVTDETQSATSTRRDYFFAGKNFIGE